MSEAMNPQYPGNSAIDPMDQEYPANSRATSPNDLVESHPPTLVFFAGVMILLLGGFEIVWAVVEFLNVAWLATVTYGDFDRLLWLWAILDLILAAAAIYAGYDILRGGTFGRIVGIVVAAVSALRWFFYLPASPWIGVVMIAVDIIIIYALVAHGDYFDTASTS
jgi:hypothetical protein